MSITAQAPSSNLEAREGETITLRISPSPDSSFERSFQNEKFTVGSSARCDLQLTQPGVQPLHCVFVRKPAAVQVTSWAAGVVLNDNPFQTATFNPGDVIRVGAVQIAWVNQKNEFDEENNDPTGSLEIAPEFSGEPEEDNVDWGVTPTSESEAATYQASTQADPRQAERSAFSDWLVYQTTVGRETSRSRCKQLMKTCRDSREVASGLADQIEQLEKRLAEASQERLTLQAESDQLAAQSTEDSQRRLGQVEELENQLTSLREELESTRQELAVQSKLQEDAQAAQEQLQLERDELATAVNDQSLSEEGVSELLAERDRQLEEVRTELANARDALAGAEEQLNTQTERFDLLETELKERNEEIARLTDQLAAAENNQEAGELGERCDLLQTALDAAEKRISDLSQLNLERSGELEQLRLASETWTQEKAEWQQEQSASQETLAALREQVESAQGRDEEEISDLKAERDQLRDELETAKSALEEFGDSESQRGAQLANWEEQQGEWQAEKSRLESELSEKSKAVLELKNDLEAKEKIDGSANEELTEERDRLATELAAANESLLELRDASAAQQKELEALVQQTNDASQVENTAVNEEQLAELTARLESLAIELQETRTRCDEAEARAEQLQILLDQATEQLRNLEAERGTPGSLASDESLETRAYFPRP
ncbi:MAG: FHA domain-containing protein [Lacipirellulaceae bacterium]